MIRAGPLVGREPIHPPRAWPHYALVLRECIGGMRLAEPVEHSQRAKRVPAARLALGLHLEVALSVVHVLERPAAVGGPAAFDDLDNDGKIELFRTKLRLSFKYDKS